MIKPTVHLGGTMRGELQRQYSDMRLAAHKAIVALESNGPHARDYPDGSFSRARDEHIDRILRLEAVFKELTELLEHVSE